MAISASFDTGQLGPESRRSRRASEIWLLTGSTGIATDTVAITTRYIKKNAKCISGAFLFSTSGQVITLTALVALGNGVAAVEIIGDV
jgi:hypothetical protein